MSAQIVHLSEVIASRYCPQTELPAACDAPAGLENISFWTGASGRRYVHTVFNLMSCPEVPSANYILVRRDASGDATALKVGVVDHPVASLNLAELRHRAARIGASEIHIHLLANRPEARSAVRIDLAANFLPAAQAGDPVALDHDPRH